MPVGRKTAARRDHEVVERAGRAPMIQSHSSSSIICSVVREDARCPRVEDEQTRVAEVAVEGPAACRRPLVPLACQPADKGRRRPQPSRAAGRPA
jgi:hypothetical protein